MTLRVLSYTPAEHPVRKVLITPQESTADKPLELYISFSGKVEFPESTKHRQIEDTLELGLLEGTVGVPPNVGISFKAGGMYSFGQVIGVIASPAYFSGINGITLAIPKSFHHNLYANTINNIIIDGRAEDGEDRHNPSGRTMGWKTIGRNYDVGELAAQMQLAIRQDAEQPLLSISHTGARIKLDPKSYQRVTPLEACMENRIIYLSGHGDIVLYNIDLDIKKFPSAEDPPKIVPIGHKKGFLNRLFRK